MAIFPPALILMVGALLLPAMRGPLRAAWMVLVPLAALAQVVALPSGFMWQWEILDWRLLILRADALSQSFAYVFGIATVLGAVYTLHTRDTLQQTAVLFYAGAAMLGVYAGDLVTLFIAWELTAIASVFLIWAQRDEASWHAGLRYLLVQVTSGLLLLAGILMLQRDGGSLRFEWLGVDDTAGMLLLAAVAIKGAFPLLHAWLTDAYPRATGAGAVFMCMFTTKLAMYTLVRGFAGVEILVWIGVIGAVYALARMAMDSDARRIVCWALLVQLGMITAGVGVGTPAALAGATLHAFAGIFYIGLMMMALGAVRLRTGTMRLDRLGGLFRTMPVTAIAFMVGAASLSALPPFAGYLSKSVLFATYPQWAYAVFMFVSAGVFLVAGLRLTWAIFFSESRGDEGSREEAPMSMIVAMTAMATLCVSFALSPQQLLAQLPWRVVLDSWAVGAILSQLVILVAVTGVFLLLRRADRMPPLLDPPPPDVDWLYRAGLHGLVFSIMSRIRPLWNGLMDISTRRARRLVESVHRHHGPQGTLARTWPTGSMVLWVAVILAVALILHYL